MTQLAQHRHADLIFLSARQNPLMESMDERKGAAHRKAVGERIAKLRDGKGWTQAQLAPLAGISQPSLSDIEAGKTKEVTASSFIGICRALGTTWEFLWAGGDYADAPLEAELVSIFRALPHHTARQAILDNARTVRAAIPVSGDEAHVEQRHRRPGTNTTSAGKARKQ